MENIIEKKAIKRAIKPPSMWQVTILNDDFTTVEFVVACLCEVFNKNVEEAFAITMDVHKKGKAVIGKYTKDIALTKQKDAMDFAKSLDHPLQVIAEPEA